MAEPGHSPSEPNSEDRAVGQPASRDDWEALPDDPDLRADLGYELVELESYETGEGRLLFLPRDEDMLRDEAFIIVEEAGLAPLEE